MRRLSTFMIACGCAIGLFALSATLYEIQNELGWKSREPIVPLWVILLGALLSSVGGSLWIWMSPKLRQSKTSAVCLNLGVLCLCSAFAVGLGGPASCEVFRPYGIHPLFICPTIAVLCAVVYVIVEYWRD
jgi:hypothetical protein